MSVVARPAATVIVARDGSHPTAPLEVLMVRRNPGADFVGGAYVFPGGAVDGEDGAPEIEALCVGRTDEEASRILKVAGRGLDYWVAAVRECFEEAGLLLAYGADPGREADRRLLGLGGPETARRFRHLRAELNGRRLSFVDLCRAERLRLALDRLHYFAHWITPEGAPRRFDTRFFVAEAPPDQTAAHDAREVVDDVWIRPVDALALHAEGRIELIFPTIRTLEAIGRFGHSAELVGAAEEASAAGGPGIPTLLPRVVRDGNGMRIVLPGDPAYEEAGPPDPGTAAWQHLRSGRPDGIEPAER